MIEKVMKAVKRNSKRRSVNITIGAVVGFLLSCTAVMGETVKIVGDGEKFEVTTSIIEENTLENDIYTNNGMLKHGGISVFGKSADGKLSVVNNGSITTGFNGIGIAEDTDLEGDITNNGTITSTGAGIGLMESTAEVTGKITNNGTILSTAAEGINISGKLTAKDGTAIENNGIIETENTTSGDSNGILVKGTVTGNIENRGAINSANSGTEASFGIRIESTGTVGNIKNDGVINSSSETGSSYGIHNLGTITGNIENNGIINAISDKGYVCGIYYNNGKIQENIVNRGLIASVTDSPRNSVVGIGAFKTTKKVLNTGYINSNGNYAAFGIGTGSSGEVNEIINNGNIYADAIDPTTDSIVGLNVANSPEEKTSILNNGLINSTKTGMRIATTAKISQLHNRGVTYGKENAVNMGGSASIATNNNYGLLISEGNDRTGVLSGTTLSKNYGLAFSVGIGDKIGRYFLQKTDNYPYQNQNGSLINATLQETGNYGDTGEVTGTNSVLSSALTTDSNNKYIINGIDNTLEVVDTDKTLKSSVINAYGTAMIMKDGKALTVEETIFNGGVNGAATISLAGNNTLNLSKESIVNGNMEIGGDSNTLSMDKSSVNGKMAATGDRNNLTIVESYLNDELAITGSNNTLDMKKSSMNGKVATTGDNNNLTIADSGINDEIAITGNNNTLTISGENTFINGDMDATGEKNTVNLAGKTGEDSSLNMFNNISGFENMNITAGNVTFFENAEVTGVEKLTVAADGTLNLRLKKVGEPNEDGLTKGGHAFSNNGEMVMEGLGDGGILKFITNGIGEGVWIDTSDMQIKNMIVKTNSVLDKYKFDEDGNLILKAVDTLGDMNSSGDKITDSKDPAGDGSDDDSNIGDSDDIFEHENFDSIDGIYKGIFSSTNKNDNLDALRNLAMTDRNTGDLNEVMSKEEQMENLQAYLNEIYTQSPYALSSELSRRSAGMFRDIVTENMFRPDLNKWMIMGGLTHIDGGTKDTYYGEVYQMDGKNSLNTEADMKLTGAYALGKYGYSENIALGVTVGGNRSEAELSKSKVKGNSGYIGAFAENYRGNLTLKAGAGIQYSEYDADRSTVGGHSYNDKYSDMAYDIYLNGRYSNPVGENLFLEPYATLSYTYVDQEGTDEGSKALAIKTDSKSFEYTSAEVGVDLKKVIPHEKGKSTLSTGVSYTRLFNGADSDKLTGNFGGSDFDILVAGKNKHNLGLNAKYTLELESGVLFDVKGSYSFERDSHKDNARNRNKGEWMVGAGLGYKF